MKTEWIIAKYVPDLARYEPRNVGIVLRCDDIIMSLFRGATKDGNIDGRSLGKQFSSLRNYKSWVRHWKRTIDRMGCAGFGELAELHGRRDTNYFLEYGGERIYGADSISPEDFLDELFSRLAEESANSRASNLTTRESLEQFFCRLGIEDRIEEGVQITTSKLDYVPFDYRYRNGRDHYLKLVPLGLPGRNAWDTVHAAAWALQALTEISDSSHGCAVITGMQATEESYNQV